MKSTIVSIVTGDWSGDGHNITETVVAELAGDFTDAREELKASYRSMLKAGYPDLQDKIARNYEDCTVTKDDYNKLRELLPNLMELEEEEEIFEEWDSDLHVEAYIAMVNRGFENLGKNIKLTIAAPDSTVNMNIGGYGLFSS